jgi:ubiquinone/menaquinone biosynthesis C-methylase UbiE
MSVQKAYNQWAEQYDSMENKTRDLERKAKQQILSSIQFSNILELGCGTGKNTEWIATKANQVIAVDFSEEMLEKARKKITAQHVSFVQADISKPWDFISNKPDLITCSLILEHILDLDFVFAEAFKALEKDGLFYICELHPFKQYTGSKARYEQDNETHVLECYTHHLSEYTLSAKKAGFELNMIDEWFDTEDRTDIPRLISFLFKKP